MGSMSFGVVIAAQGTGKTMAAEAIGFDVGRPLMVVNCAQLMDKYVGESAKNIEKVAAAIARALFFARPLT